MIRVNGPYRRAKLCLALHLTGVLLKALQKEPFQVLPVRRRYAAYARVRLRRSGNMLCRGDPTRPPCG